MLEGKNINLRISIRIQVVRILLTVSLLMSLNTNIGITKMQKEIYPSAAMIYPKFRLLLATVIQSMHDIREPYDGEYATAVSAFDFLLTDAELFATAAGFPLKKSDIVNWIISGAKFK